MASTPVAIVCIGMAGSGKTTFMQRINSYLHSQRQPPYVINLDPAVRTVPFDSNIDIRDSIDYKEVMKQYNLGPNGGILTSLNLFSTKVDQVMGILETRCPVPTASTQTTTPQPASKPSQPPINHILIDTPGQIEVFVWSASGQILLSSLASTYPTVLAYIIDTPRTTSTATFMANMLYACSILYKTKLPMVLVFNKSDVKDVAFAKEWMTDFEAFQAAVRREEEEGVPGGMDADNDGGTGVPGFGSQGGSGYMHSLLNSMSLVLEEFYAHLKVVGVSAMTGEGIKEFFEAVEEKRVEFEAEYQPELERRRTEVQAEKVKRREAEMGRLMSDLDIAGAKGSGKSARRARKPRKEPETISDIEDEDQEDEGDEDENDGIIEPDDEMSEEGEGDDAIDAKYRQATRHNDPNLTGEGSTADDDVLSFERYIRNSQAGGKA